MDFQVCSVVESTLRQLSFYRGILNECDENVAEDNTDGESMDVLRSLAIGCVNRGIIRQDELNILNGLSLPIQILRDQQYMDQPSMEEIEELCGRILSDFENQEALVDRIVKVQNKDIILSKHLKEMKQEATNIPGYFYFKKKIVYRCAMMPDLRTMYRLFQS